MNKKLIKKIHQNVNKRFHCTLKNIIIEGKILQYDGFYLIVFNVPDNYDVGWKRESWSTFPLSNGIETEYSHAWYTNTEYDIEDIKFFEILPD